MKKLLMLMLLFGLASIGWAQDKAFPHAEGYGTSTPGGRNGTIYKVTNLNDSGPGSLRACMQASGPRVCVFEVGGWINLLSTISVRNPYLTVYGQTAPGSGIGLRNTQNRNGTTPIDVTTHDVVIQYLTIRPGPGNTLGTSVDAFGGASEIDNGFYNVVFDHISASWTVDQIAATWYDAANITFSYNLLTDPLHYSLHTKEGDHGMGLMPGGYAGYLGGASARFNDPATNFSIHHNFMAHIYERAPDVDNGGINDVVNNVLYNITGATNQIISRYGPTVNRTNVIGNYLKEGPNVSIHKYLTKAYLYNHGGSTGSAEIYASGNYHSYYRTSTSQADNLVVDSAQRTISAQNTVDSIAHMVSARFEGPPAITTQSAFDGTLLSEVTGEGKAGNSRRIDCNGQWINRRDAVDKRVIAEFQLRTGKQIDAPGAASCLGRCRGASYTLQPSDYTSLGITDKIETGEYEGWPVYSSGTACTDTDNDGMPDIWEIEHGLNPNSAADAWTMHSSGFRNLEVYVAGLAPVNDFNAKPMPPTGLRFVE